MSKINKYIGKEANHKIIGLVLILSRVKKSITIVEIKCLQRAKGWDESTQSYKSIKTVRSNINADGIEIGKTFYQKTYTDKNSHYGLKDISHIKDLILI